MKAVPDRQKEEYGDVRQGLVAQEFQSLEDISKEARERKREREKKTPVKS